MIGKNEVTLHRTGVDFARQLARNLVLLVAIWFAGWTALFAFNLDRLYDDVVTRDFEVFGSDGQDTVALLAGRNKIMMDHYKHPLFASVGRGLHEAVSTVIGADERKATVWTLALIGGVVMCQLALALRAYFGAESQFWLGSAFFGVSFASLVIFSIPETYGVTMMAFLAFLHLFFLLRRSISNVRALVLGAMIGLVALGNVTLLTAGMIPGCYLLATSSLRTTIVRSTLILSSSVAVYFGIVLFMFGSAHLSFSGEYADRWFSFAHFTDVREVISVLFQFLVFPVVGAGESLQELYRTADAQSYLTSPAALLALICFGGLCIAAFGDGFRSRHPTGLALHAWMIVLILLYIGFNPREAILYSIQVLPVLAFTVVYALRSADLRRRWMALVMLACMALHNFGILHVVQVVS